MGYEGLVEKIPAALRSRLLEGNTGLRALTGEIVEPDPVPGDARRDRIERRGLLDRLEALHMATLGAVDHRLRLPGQSALRIELERPLE